MMRSLIWKEWHEQRWKLGFGCVILCSYAALALRARLVPDEMVVWHVLGIGLLLLPVLAVMGAIAPERVDGSYGFLRMLPTPAWHILAVKTAIGLLQCVGPIAAAAALSIIITHQREMTVAGMLGLYARGMVVAGLLFVWMLALAIHLPTEARAGLIGLGALVFWLLATAGLTAATIETYPQWQVISWPWAVCPFGPLVPQVVLGIVLPVQLALAAAASLWTAVRFAHLEGVRA